MFSWFWEFLYMISKTLFRLIDGLILCANKLCGIDPINFNGEETDFLSYLLFSDEIGFAFKVSVIIATILLVLFTVFMILRSISKDKVEGTPAQIAVKSFKTLLMFFFVPVAMIAFMTLGNAFVKALYAATKQNASTTGAFLFCSFAADGGMNPESVELFKVGELDYYVTSQVNEHMNLADFPFLFSWIAGAVVLVGIGYSMLTFVDRVFSLVILYIAAPISISTSVLDDGARFKLWRDQFLSKFIMGYGMIIAINLYALVCGLITAQGFSFFPDNSFLDLIMKLLIMAGGALAMQKSMALVGNLVASGAGSAEFRENAMSMGQFARGAGGLMGGLMGAPFKLFKGNKNGGGKSKDGGKGKGKGNDKESGKSSEGDKDFKLSNWGADNKEKPKYGNSNNSPKDAIEGKSKNSNDGNGGNGGNSGNGNNKNDNDNTNSNQTKQGNNNLANAINGDGITERKNDEGPKEDNK